MVPELPVTVLPLHDGVGWYDVVVLVVVVVTVTVVLTVVLAVTGIQGG